MSCRWFLALMSIGALPVEPAVAAPPDPFATCGACHSTASGGASGIGPNLSGIVGAKAGMRPGYPSSAAMKASGIIWSKAMLDRFLAAPTKVVPGTRMTIGVVDAARRQAIIAYLTTLK